MAKGRKTGGRVAGKPNKAKADIAEIINKVIPPEVRIGLAAELAHGVTVQENLPKGETKIYTKPPDMNAIRFLEEYATGKPIQRTELTGAGGESLRIILSPR